MKNKRLFLILFLTIACGNAFSQKTIFGLSIGMNTAKCYSPFNGFFYSQDAYSNAGTDFSIGYYAKVPIKKHLIFQPIFSYIKKSTSDNTSLFDPYTNNITYTKSKVSADIGELILNYLYHPAEKNGFFIGAGPSFTLGNYKNELSYSYLDFSYNRNSASFLPGLGANLVCGFEFSQRFAVTTNYNFEVQTMHRFKYFGLNLQYTFK